jgi:hypothetical protein
MTELSKCNFVDMIQDIKQKVYPDIKQTEAEIAQQKVEIKSMYDEIKIMYDELIGNQGA